MNVAEYTIKFLESKGIKRIYGVTGGAIMYLTESIRKSNIEFIPFMHEQAAGIAAEADSILNNSPAVLLTTAGPGILNAINPINSAWIDGNSLLVIGGQCKTSDSMEGTGLRQKGVQEVNAVDILKPITKYSYSIDESKDIRRNLERSFYLMSKGRKGPCFLELPLDIQNEEIDENNLQSFYITNEQLQKSIKEDFDKDVKFQSDIDKLVELLYNSKKPIILAGNGIRQSGALQEFYNLITWTGIPVLLTWKSLDILDDKYTFGRPGSIASRYANNILQECDLLISIGARIDLPSCAYNYQEFAKKAKKVIVDIDKSEIDKLEFDKELIFNCDAKIFIEKLLKEVGRGMVSSNPSICFFGWQKPDDNYHPWLDWCKDQKEKYPICLPEYYENKDFINPYAFVEEVSKQLTSNDIIVAASSGSASEIMAQAFKIKEGQRYISSNGLGSMGYGLAHSIGAWFASDKKKRIILVEGEGSFNMNIQELELVKRYNIPMIVFIWNNNGYKSIRDTHTKFFNAKIGCDKESGVSFPDLEKIVNAYEIEYFKIENNDHLYMIESDILKRNLPIIVEVIIDPEFSMQPKVQSYVDKDGKIQSGKLENMWPFLKEGKNIITNK